MFKALLKMQFKQFLSSFKFKNKKTGQAVKSGAGLVIVIWALVGFSLFMAFLGESAALGDALFPVDAGWLFFALMGLMAITMGVFVTTLGLYSAVYKAKDNELLLSMPIPPKYIIIVRLLPSFGISLIASFIGMCPAIIVSHDYLAGSGDVLIQQIILMICLACIALAISCLIGWLIAIIASKVKNKSIGTTIFTVILLGLYYTFQFNANKLLNKLVEDALTIGIALKKSVYPVYAFGAGFTGGKLETIIVVVIALVCLALVYFFMARSFIKLVTRKTEGVKAKAQKAERSSIAKTLIKKENKRLLGSAAYMVNCGLGLAFMLAVPVVGLIKRADILASLEMMRAEGINIDANLPLIVALGLFCFSGMVFFSAPSLSLEGKSFWIIRTLPVDMADLLKAKVRMHWNISLPVLVIDMIFAFWFLGLDWISCLQVALCVLVFNYIVALTGTSLGVCFPVFDWVNETQCVKSGAAMGIDVFAGMVFTGLIAVVYFFLLKSVVTVSVYLWAVLAVLVIVCLLLRHWLYTKGAKKVSLLDA